MKSIILFVIILLANITKGQRRVITEDLFSDQIFELLSQKVITKSQVGPFLAKIGDHRNALRFDGASSVLGFDTITIVDKNYFKEFKALSANQSIPEIAGSYQVVMINEDHSNAQHRVFTKSLLEGLYEKGYRILFLEALSTQTGYPPELQDTLLHERKYVLDSPVSGTYVREPQFSNMIRHAISLGYRVLPYDGRSPNREIKSVKNIGEVLKFDPEVKAVIHCGYGHLYEAKFGNSSWLGKNIKDSLGIDPLTIDQVILTERPGGIESPFYTMIDFDKPTIFLDSDNKAYNGFRDMKHFDLLVYQPRTLYTFNRPNWLIQQQDHHLKEVKTENNDFPLLIKAFKITDNLKAVPIDTIEKKFEGDPSYLVLPKGQYRVEIKAKTRLVETKTIVVN